MCKIDNYIVNDKASCRDAMKKIDSNLVKIVFVVSNNRLVASLTDGDIRRYLISNGALDGNVLNAANLNPKSAYNITSAEDLCNEYKLIAIPIVDDKQNLIDIFFKDKNNRVYKAINNVPIVINAGGKGTRLDPFTKVLPKPLIPVGDLPIIEHIMQEFGKYSLNSFDIIVNYKKELIKTYFSETENKYSINWYNEEKPLGTGGGLSFLKPFLKETFFFTNCDILITADYESILRYHRDNSNLITMVCAYKTICIPYGVIEMEKTGSIESMKEKPEISFLTNTGFYIVDPSVLGFIEDNVAIGFPDVIKKVQDAGGKVGVYPISEDDWMDMGELDELGKMRKKLYGE